jgi:hypothetical protein
MQKYKSNWLPIATILTLFLALFILGENMLRANSWYWANIGAMLALFTIAGWLTYQEWRNNHEQ